VSDTSEYWLDAAGGEHISGQIFPLMGVTLKKDKSEGGVLGGTVRGALRVVEKGRKGREGLGGWRVVGRAAQIGSGVEGALRGDQTGSSDDK
jgi:hypothetical protein